MKILSGVGVRPTKEFDIIIDPSGQFTLPKPLEFSNICDDNECELFVGYILDYIPINKIDNILNDLVKKTRINGRIILHGTNINELNRAYFMGHIGTPEYNSILYGLMKCGIYCPDVLSKKFESMGLSIASRKLDKLSFSIEVVRVK